MIINPHKNISREVNDLDIEIIKKIAPAMIDFCKNPKGNFKEILALAHCQVEEEEPLRFFVTNEDEIIINPEIIRHTKTTVKSEEGCVSFPNTKPVIVERWNKCEVIYQTIENNKLSEFKKENLSGQKAKMYQHEIQHFAGQNIYDK